MDDLLLRFLRGGTTQAENDKVSAWLQESPDNQAHLRAIGEILALARSRDGRTDPGDPPVAADLIRQAQRSRPPSKWVERDRPPVWAISPLAVAATAALVALGLLSYERWVSGEAKVRLAAEELMTGAGESTTVRMSDGSVVRLGPESRLQVVPDGSGRQVVLVGRAFFAVTPDEKRPFRVHTPNGSIRVWGTRFQLEAGVEDIRLVVVEGTVTLVTSGSEVELRTGEMTRTRYGRAGVVEKAPGIAELSSEWMGQFLLFQKTPLARAAEELEEIYNVEVRILDAALGEKTLTMWFSSRPLEEVLAVVCTVIDAQCRIEGRIVSIGIRGDGLSANLEEALIQERGLEEDSF